MVTDQDRARAIEVMFPVELFPLVRYRLPRADEMSDEQRSQVDRIAAALADVRRTAYDAGFRAADNGNNPDPEWMA